VRWIGAGVLMLGTMMVPARLHAQRLPVTAPSPPATTPSPIRLAIGEELRGRRVEDVRIVGNQQVATAVIINVIRTRPGEPFDPLTVTEDYQRVYQLKHFSNVEARVEPTAAGGVVVIFEVDEQDQIRQIAFSGNSDVKTETLTELVDLRVGQSIDMFRIGLARQAIETLYQDRNYPYAHVTVDADELARSGVVTFQIVEGPNVRIRKVAFIGNNSFTTERLKGVVQTKSWIWIFRSGTFEPRAIDDDIGLLREYYEGRGFFDVRVGRQVVYSPDLRELQINFIIEEGRRYKIGELRFQGNVQLSDAMLRPGLTLQPGAFFNRDLLQRDIRQIVRAYSPLGFIYQPETRDPDYLTIRPQRVFGREPGTVDLKYEIREGKPFRLGRIMVKGNPRTRDKVVLREMRVSPGHLYNSAEIADAMDRLRGTPYFATATATPVGNDPDVRDLIVEVEPKQTASLTVGAGVNSDGGVGASIEYEQRNFDASAWPERAMDVFSDRAFIGAGQSLKISLQPGTEQSNASIRFREPYLFDQPYGFTGEAYYRQYQRDDYDDRRAGGRISLDKRLNYVWSAALHFRGEDVLIDNINDPLLRAPEILETEGHSTLTSVGPSIERNTTNRGILPFRGTRTLLRWDSFGALGGDYSYQRYTLGFDSYHSLHEDLLERRTILNLHLDTGYIDGDVPFFEAFYAGGLGSVRGFSYRGISPRSGPEDDAIGGNFLLTGTVEVSFPLIGETIRGVVFTDGGTVEEEARVSTVRLAAGGGVRLTKPISMAIDLAWPLNKDDEDETRIISFSFGLIP
jgi:outer membrane protein insertion porin family